MARQSGVEVERAGVFTDLAQAVIIGKVISAGVCKLQLGWRRLRLLKASPARRFAPSRSRLLSPATRYSDPHSQE